MPVRKFLVVFSCLCVATSTFGQQPVTAPAPIGSGPGMAPPPTGYFEPQYDPGMDEFGMGAPPADLPPIPNSWLESAWNPQPWIEARFETLWLMPDFPDSVPLGSQVRPVDSLNYEIRDIRLTAASQYTASFRTALEYHFSPNLSVEGVWFTMDGPNQLGQPAALPDSTIFLDATVTNPNISDEVLATLPPGFAIDSEGNAVRRGFLRNLPAGFPTEAEEMNLDWDFRSYGADFSVLYHWVPLQGHLSDLAFGVGGRYLNVEENVDVFFLDDILTPPSTGNIRSRTDNDLAGPQITARARVQGPGSRIRSVAELKIGLLANNQRATNSVLANGELISQNTYSRTVVSPLFESNFYIEFFLIENLSLYGGFQLLYADRVGRGSEQITEDLALFGTEHKALGSLFMFGPRAGFTLSY